MQPISPRYRIHSKTVFSNSVAKYCDIRHGRMSVWANTSITAEVWPRPPPSHSTTHIYMAYAADKTTAMYCRVAGNALYNTGSWTLLLTSPKAVSWALSEWSELNISRCLWIRGFNQREVETCEILFSEYIVFPCSIVRWNTLYSLSYRQSR
jgi:hypothetical protein